ncbi:hypothetical protein J437_LFUL015601 [Ladona fulva]|uniref:Transcription factor CBF/NF-Y/archaeal histone domain-containing protein n=1 Tax=Ladona fulva TaxID=123851 RepID=A0A8K0KJN3_LADFU|nr:hypothetical protein J437_LFUL015601 [Ladona fulva]
MVMMPSKKKKYNARFPPGRIKKIMQTDEEVGKVAQAVPTMEITSARNAKTLSPSHMKHCIFSESRFDFLKDLVKSLPDMAGEGEECLSSTPAARTSRLGSEVSSSSEKEKEYAGEHNQPQSNPSNPLFRVGECYKTYGNVTHSSVRDSPAYSSSAVDQLPHNNHSQTVASSDPNIPQPPVTNFYSAAKYGDTPIVSPNNLKESGIPVRSIVKSPGLQPVQQTSMTFRETLQAPTSSIELDEDYDV